ncbi:imidazole glycerol phosphate synthase subunit HisH [bacterium]|nr:imidazole glycerol phosphate synthase subunit HisH [bacterium]
MPVLGIVDYEAGNIASVTNALTVARIPYSVSSSQNVLERCSGILLPGVGAASAAMRSLKNRQLTSFLRNLQIPFLGICLGMQVLFESSEEGNVECLGILSGRVLRFDDRASRVPHMGWNQVEFNDRFLLLKSQSYFYFAHSYYAPLNDSTAGVAESGNRFAAAVRKDSYFGVQFHPEKSGEAGLSLLRSFWKLCESYQQSI